MPQYFFYNGDWLPEGQPIIVSGNRGFRYGDGLFETLCVVDGAIRLAGYHFERLFAGLQQLQLQLPPHADPVYLSAQIATSADYPTTVSGFNPLGYWRLDETAVSPPLNVLTNQGSLGASGNGIVVRQVTKGQAGGAVDAA